MKPEDFIMSLLIAFALFISGMLINHLISERVKEEECIQKLTQHFPTGEVHQEGRRTSILWKNECNEAKYRLTVYNRGDVCKY